MRGLASGTTLEKALQLVKRVRTNTQIPIFFMMSYNLVYHYGIEKFVKAMEENQVNGVVIPDLPPEEAPKGLKPTYLIAPTTSPSRMGLITKASHSFIYLVSNMGVTGMRDQLPPSLGPLIKKVKSLSDKPVYVGFGIATPEQAKAIVQYADGIIVGSALVTRLNLNISQGIAFIKSLRQALNS
jgi:tryptophan synthase alpha chain